MYRWCFEKGMVCENATVSGRCSKSVCNKFKQSIVMEDWSIPPKYDTLPSDITINGIKYRRVEE